jgi:hypothetical protein
MIKHLCAIHGKDLRMQEKPAGWLMFSTPDELILPKA